jgi:uncharacterized protein
MIMPREEEKISREEAGRKGGEASAGKERHFTPESKERLKEGDKKGGESEKDISPEARERIQEVGRKGGEHSYRND